LAQSKLGLLHERFEHFDFRLEMDTNSTVATNTGVLPTHGPDDPHYHYGWAAAGMVVFILIAWGLRKIFWQKDSN
jgi:hypothetical protein